MVELRGSARSQAFASSRDDTFKTLREKIALKVGRPDEACFIAATVRVAYRFGNLSATSSTAVDPRSRAPHDHECVYSTLEALRLQHHGAIELLHTPFPSNTLVHNFIDDDSWMIWNRNRLKLHYLIETFLVLFTSSSRRRSNCRGAGP